MATQPQIGLTYDDLQAFPEDNLRRELIDGELIVTAAPATRHQRVVVKLVGRLFAYSEVHGGEVLTAPFDVYFSETNVVEPDLLYVRPENRDRLEQRVLPIGPGPGGGGLVSPSTRRLELISKRELYERFGVPEYWFVELDADRVEVYRLEQDRYGHPLLFTRGEALETLLGSGTGISRGRPVGPAGGLRAGFCTTLGARLTSERRCSPPTGKGFASSLPKLSLISPAPA